MAVASACSRLVFVFVLLTQATAMKYSLSQFLLPCVTCFALLVGASSVGAQAIWHCSRAPSVAVSQATVLVEDDFKLSSFDSIGVMLDDLLNVYLGRDVRIGKFPLKACFMPGDNALSRDALESLGLKSQVMKKLAAKSAIVQNQVVLVTDEQQMLQCMERNFPAFGYFASEVITEKVVPCF